MAKRPKRKTRKQKIAESKKQPTFGRTPKKLRDELNAMEIKELGK